VGLEWRIHDAARTVTLPASGAVGTADVGLEWRIHDAARTVTLPASGAVGTADVGLEWRIHDAARTADTAPVTIQAPAGVTLNGTVAGSAQIVTNGGAAIVRVVAANTWETVGL
jgi:hypothetical protein